MERDNLLEKEILSLLSPELPLSLLCFDELPSTNTFLKELGRAGTPPIPCVWPAVKAQAGAVWGDDLNPGPGKGCISPCSYGPGFPPKPCFPLRVLQR